MDLPTAIRRLSLMVLADDPDEALRELVGSQPPLTAAVRDGLLRHAHWHLLEIDVAVLAEVAGGADRLVAAVGRGPLVGSCIGCGRGLRATSREDVDAVEDGPRRCREECGRARRRAVPPPRRPWPDAPPAGPGRRTVHELAPGRRAWAEHYDRPAA